MTPVVVKFVSDTEHDFESKRKDYIDEIVWGKGGINSSNNNGNGNGNPYFVKEPSFTNQTLLNILKMWHSQDSVWNLMEKDNVKVKLTTHNNNNNNNNINADNNHFPKYRRVAMLRLDVIYTTPIDIYKIPRDPIPEDYNQEYLQGLRRPKEKKQLSSTEYYYYHFDDWQDPNRDHQYRYQYRDHCVLPGFKSFPVNDRYFAGPYEAAKLWAKDRFGRARRHVTKVLPALDLQLQRQRQKQQAVGTAAVNDAFANQKMTDYGLHDERFVAYTILPAIRNLHSGPYNNNNDNNNNNNNTVGIQVDRNLYFARVRADGSIWLKDKPGFGRVKTVVLEKALGRKCTGKPYQVKDGVLQEKSPGLWQIKCPPTDSLQSTID
eukprot:CAMPEP_0168291668 /NCGR_PEP_ID=MMETSP0142_2-20121227/6474_1 /TAXON_ID=44445 /ORGANISM="Pseudo-nitzschia australis, Strain 10249 10 AB" /LENGTH=376 /DNA_ID=CAMNT_0008239251 /DNA_START=51 /DNA_END=1181 /DNA_ORIENTATION=-